MCCKLKIKGEFMFHFVQILLAVPIRLSYPTKFIGKENIPKGPCIIASNHTSNLDAVLLAVHTWEKKFYLAKKELFKNKLFGSFLKSVGAIEIDRQATDVGAIKNCMRILKKGKKLVIFPEGTRNHNDDMQLGQVKHGVSMLAIKAKVPIVPMFIAKQPKFWRRNKVIIGKPFLLEEFYGKKLDNEILTQASDIVAAKMNELRESQLNALTKKK